MSDTANVPAATANWAERLVAAYPGKAAQQLAYAQHQAAGASPMAGLYATRATALEAALSAAVRCTDCGRTLTDENSKARGIGPECAAKRQ